MLPADFPAGSVGAVVVGGDYQGLGIVRSLGIRGIPVCVVDDEYSISRFSRYSTHHVKVANLRDERAAVEELIGIGKKLNLQVGSFIRRGRNWSPPFRVTARF